MEIWTRYLYGVGLIGEQTDSWAYDLPDGTNAPRQLVNTAAEVTFAVRYTPWGGNPSAAFVAPLALISPLYGRKKKGSMTCPNSSPFNMPEFVYV